MFKPACYRTEHKNWATVVKSTARQIKQTIMLVKQANKVNQARARKMSLVCTQQNEKSFLILRYFSEQENSSRKT